MVPVLLRVNHERDGRTDGQTDGRTDSDDGNRGKATFGCVSPKMESGMVRNVEVAVEIVLQAH